MGRKISNWEEEKLSKGRIFFDHHQPTGNQEKAKEIYSLDGGGWWWCASEERGEARDSSFFKGKEEGTTCRVVSTFFSGTNVRQGAYPVRSEQIRRFSLSRRIDLLHRMR